MTHRIEFNKVVTDTRGIKHYIETSIDSPQSGNNYTNYYVVHHSKTEALKSKQVITEECETLTEALETALKYSGMHYLTVVEHGVQE